MEMVLKKVVVFTWSLFGYEKRIISKNNKEMESSSSSLLLICSVCLSRMKEGDNVRVLPCMHHYHRPCVDTWFSSGGGRKTCPVCRSPVVDDDGAGDHKTEKLTEEMVIWFSSFHIAGF